MDFHTDDKWYYFTSLLYRHVSGLLPTPHNHSEIVFTILFSSYHALYWSHLTLRPLRVSFLGTFLSCFLVGVSSRLLNYSFSHSMTAGLSGNYVHAFTGALLSFCFHIQFKDYLIVSKTFFSVLMRSTPTWPKVRTWRHQTENGIPSQEAVYFPNILPSQSPNYWQEEV